MIAPVCQHEKRKKFGKTSSGAQRFRCCSCGKSFTESTERFDGMRFANDAAEQVIRHLCEGTSIRSTVRLTGTSKDTILALLELVGPRCKRFLREKIAGHDVKEVQLDEIWGFIGMKQKTARRLGIADTHPVGDAYCFTAIERNTKLLLAFHLGRRDDANTDMFIDKLQDALCGHFHLSTDGWICYPNTIMRTFGRTIEYGRIIKIFGKLAEIERRRYSAPHITAIERDSIIGDDAKYRACTSHMERCNGSIRLFTKRMNRLTYAFSKKWENHESALALFFAYYNFCWPHSSLNVKNGPRRTPAMAAGLTDHVWTVEELLAATANA